MAATFLLTACPDSATEPEPCSDEVITLTSDVAQQVDVSLGCDALFRIQVPENSDYLAVTATSNPQNVTLSLRHAQPPTTSDYICRREDGVCDVGGDKAYRNPDSGDWYILVEGDARDVRVWAKVYPIEPPTDITILTSGVAKPFRLALMPGSRAYYQISVPIGSKRLEVKTSGGTGDADLFVGRGTNPASMDVECSSTGGTNTESCVIDNPVAGTWYIELLAHESYNGLSITATVGNATSTPPTTPTPPGTSCDAQWKPILTGAAEWTEASSDSNIARWGWSFSTAGQLTVTYYYTDGDVDRRPFGGYSIVSSTSSPTGCAFQAGGVTFAFVGHSNGTLQFRADGQPVRTLTR